MGKTLYVVLGMHRSGTSAITRGLQALGVELGDRLMPPVPEVNEKGFFEDVEVNALNVELLGALDHDWHALRPIEAGRFAAAGVERLKSRALAILQERFRAGDVFGIKDPRLSLLLPFWIPVFAQMGIAVKYVVVVRNPLGVAKSLARHHRIPAEKSHYLWLEYLLPSLLLTRGAARVVVDYDRMLDDPDHELDRMARALDMPAVSDEADLEEYAQGFLEARLRHARFHLDDLDSDPAVPETVRELARLLDRLSLDDASPADEAVADALLNLEKQWLDMSPAMLALDRIVASQDGRIGELSQAIVDKDRHIGNLDLMLVQRDGKLAEVAGSVADKDRHIGNLELMLSERERRIEEQRQAVLQRDGQVAVLHETVNQRDTRVTEFGQAMAQREGQIVFLHDALARRETRIAELDRTVSQRDGDIADLYETLKQCETQIAKLDHKALVLDGEIAGLNAAIKVREGRIDELDQTVVLRDKRIAELHDAALQIETRVAELDRAVADREGLIAELNETARRGEEQIAELDESVRQRDSRIAELDEVVRERVTLIAELGQSVLERDGRIAKLTQVAQAHEDRIADLDQSVRQRDGRIEELLQVVEQRETLIAELDQLLMQRDGQLADSNQAAQAHAARIAELDQLLMQRDGQLAESNQAAQAHEARIAELDQLLMQRDGQLAESNQVAQAHEVRIAELDQLLMQRDGQLAESNQVAQAHEARIAELDQLLMQRDGQLAESNQATQAHEARIAELDQLIMQRDGQLADSNRAAQAHEARIAELDQLLMHRDGQLAESNQVAQTREARIGELDQLLMQRDGQLAESNQAAQAHEARIGELDQLLMQRDGQLAESNQAAQAHEARIVELDQLLMHRDGQLAESNQAAQTREARIAELDQLLMQRDGQLAESNQATQAHAARIGELDHLLMQRDGLLAESNQAAQAREARIQALELEQAKLAGALNEASANLEDIETNSAWRVAGPLLKLWRTVEYTWLGRGYRFRMIPNGDLKRLSYASGAWEAVGDDPHFQLTPVDGDYPSGWVLVDTRLQRKSSDFTAKLYFDRGEGMSEANTAVVPVSLKGRGIEVLRLPEKIRGLRWDPMQASGEFEQAPIRISRIGWTERTFRMLRRVLPLLLKEPAETRERMGLTWSRVARDLDGAYAAAGRMRNYAPDLSRRDYRQWLEDNDRLDAADREGIASHISALASRPLISVLMPVYNTPAVFLREAIESVLAQLYENWELCIADDASSQRHVVEIVEEYRAREPRIKLVRRDKNGHISAASNSALELATGDYIALLDHDDLLPAHALYHMAVAIAAQPGAKILYSDEDKIDELGNRFDPHFKPDWNPDLLLSQNYISHLGLYDTALVREVGGFRVGYEGSQDYDLLLRCASRCRDRAIVHVPKVLYHWRCLEGSTARAAGEKSYTSQAGLLALRDYLSATGTAASVEPGRVANTYRVRYPLPRSLPLVSLLIPTRDKLEWLKPCVDSILKKTAYDHYEILILDNQSQEPETLAWFDAIARDRRVRVLRYDQPFNFSAINNFGVRHARGEIVGLVNNDIEAIGEDWLTEMVSHACRAEIGCVGAKLYYGNDTIQHAGIILGIGGVAGHSHKYFPNHAPGYFSRLFLIQDLSAVTAACMLVRKSVYEQVGGLNEADLSVAFNDVDFCLRVREAGYRNLWTPYAELYHHESISRGTEDTPEKQSRFTREIGYMTDKWGGVLRNDPAYSRNLTMEFENFSIS